jgi:uncharacterized protein
LSGPQLNYTTALNLLFLLIMAGLGWRFLRTGGLAMLRMMEVPPATTAAGDAQHQHGAHHGH